MEIPILLQKTERGRLQIRQDGLFTCFEGQCTAERVLLRLSVYGQGKEGYLGVMQPRSGGLYLRRRLSRREMDGFPQNPEYAAAAGERWEKAKVPDLPVQEKAESLQTSGTETPEGETKEEEMPVEETEEEILWLRRADGSLTGFDGNRRLLALPEDLRKKSSGVILRRIEGKSYMIFRY